LNNEFNGEGFNENGLGTLSHIEKSLESNDHEIVCVSEYDEKVVGFCCVRVNRSMCYMSCSAEITELYVREAYRRNGLATMLLKFAENICVTEYGASKLQVLTGNDNFPAQELYKALGYTDDEELLFVKEY
jgi:ribosomal protein S18 acetylase RimI-like enzyme